MRLAAPVAPARPCPPHRPGHWPSGGPAQLPRVGLGNRTGKPMAPGAVASANGCIQAVRVLDISPYGFGAGSRCRCATSGVQATAYWVVFL